MLAPFEEKDHVPTTAEGLIACHWIRSGRARPGDDAELVAYGLFVLAVAVVFTVGGLLFALLGFLW
jgi:hypothetical protein